MAIDPFFWSQPRPRIVQYNKKRYALRLENIYWQQLELLARRRSKRLGQMVAELDEAHRAGEKGPSLASFIRGFCMVEAERDANRFRLESGSFDLLDILRGAPAPAVLLNHERIILDVNPALTEWAVMGPGVTHPPVFRQQKFDVLFTPRVTRSMDETINLMRSGRLKRTQIQVAYGGRVIMATLTALSVGSIFYCLVWLNPSRQAGIVSR